jgi:hypothetical protein
MTAQLSIASATVWTCRCGQAYRMADTGSGHRFWPASGAAAYSRHGLSAETPCIRCGERIRGKRPLPRS